MKWLLVFLLWGVALLNYVDRQVIFSLFPLLEHDLHASAGQLGLISTVFLVAYGLLSPFGGYLADRWGRVRMILASLLVWSLATWMTGHAGSMGALLWARAAMGASEAFYLPAALALIADRHGPESRSLATGLHQSGLYTGLIVGGAWGGWMGEYRGWRPPFTILGIVGVIYFAVLVLALRNDAPSGGAAKTTDGVRGLLRTPGFAALTAAFTAMALVNWLIYTWLPLFLFERFRMSLSGAGFSATFYIQAASYAGVVLGGVLTDRWAARAPRVRIYGQMCGMLIAAPFLFLLGTTGSMPVLVAALITFGLGRGLFDCNTMPALRDVAGSNRSATGYGIFNMAGCLVGGAGAAMAGFLKAHLGLGGAFQIAALTLAAGGFVVLRARTPERAGSTIME